jgi:hypothetical protein
MASELPIACSLSAAELPKRLAEMRAIGYRGFISARIDRCHAALRFKNDAEISQRLEAIVAMEAECCAFLEMSLGSRGAELELSIEAPAGAEPVLEDLVAAFNGEMKLAA